MILLETEPTLPSYTEQQKAMVLTCLATMHRVKEFTTRVDLMDFLDREVLDGLARAGYQRGLTRVMLFHRTPGISHEVQRRMLPGGELLIWQAPGCWGDLARQLPELAAYARRVEPGLELRKG